MASSGCGGNAGFSELVAVVDAGMQVQAFPRAFAPFESPLTSLLTPCERVGGYSGDSFYGPQVTVAARHGSIEAAFIDEHEPLWLVQVGGQVALERRAALLTAFSGGQRFFMSCDARTPGSPSWNSRAAR